MPVKIGSGIGGELVSMNVTEQIDALSFGDAASSLIKTFFFGFAIGIIGRYKGYNSKKGIEGVG